MPKIPLEVLDSVVYLYPTREAARAGKGIGGTGFLLSKPLDDSAAADSPAALYVVTNAHVIYVGQAKFVRLNTHDGFTDVIEPLHWFRHPDGDDLAVAPIGLSAEHHRFAAIPVSECLSGPDDTVTRVLDEPGSPTVALGPGDDVFFVGRFIRHDGVQQNQPTARFGHLALMLTSVLLESGIKQEGFLVEGRSLSGYSGSPVFVYRMPYGAVIGDGELQDIRQHKLLGVDCAHLKDFRPVLLSDKKAEATDENGGPMYVEQNSGMVAVIPSWKLLELLDSEELTQMRKELAITP